MDYVLGRVMASSQEPGPSRKAIMYLEDKAGVTLSCARLLQG